MTENELQAYQIRQLNETVGELRRANKYQMEFNQDVVKFMATVATWGKVGMLLWSLFTALLVWAITKT
jgi:hypothetical protein